MILLPLFLLLLQAEEGESESETEIGTEDDAGERQCETLHTGPHLSRGSEESSAEESDGCSDAGDDAAGTIQLPMGCAPALLALFALPEGEHLQIESLPLVGDEEAKLSFCLRLFAEGVLAVAPVL